MPLPFNSSEMFSPDTIDCHLLFDLPFDFSSDYNLQASSNNNQSQQNQVDQPTCPDQLFSGNLSGLHQTTQFQSSLSFGPNLQYGYGNFSNSNCFGVKNEECQVGYNSAHNDVENVAKYLALQRSFSSNSFETNPGFSFQPPFDPLMESENFEGNQALSMPDNSFFAGQMRKVCSTGDLQNMNQRSISTPSAVENSFMEEPAFKVGRYNPEERQERISKYRAKRNQRNFNKTIKYACRKTLADNRPRIRGRFARNDEAVEIPKAACCSTRNEDEDDLWVLHEVEDDETMARGNFMNSFSQHQFQYHHGCF